MSELRSKHAFGSEANVDTALARGLIDAYDVLFLDEGKIGWIDKNGQKVILEDKQQVILASSLPSTGKQDVIYIYNNSIRIWDGSKFVSPVGEGGGVSESDVDSKISAAKAEMLQEAKTYADDVASSSYDTVVEF